MAKKESSSTKRSLWACGLSVILCLAMLIGTTLAWFSDTVSNKGNRIQAGNLQIGVYGFDKEGKAIGTDGDFSNPATPSLIDDKNWEPGQTNTKYIAIYNRGSLALKYQVSFSTMDEGLQDALWYTLTPVDAVGDADTLAGDRQAMALLSNDKSAANANMAAGNAVNVYRLDYGMNESAGNSYMNGAFSADIIVSATQTTAPDIKEVRSDADFVIGEDEVAPTFVLMKDIALTRDVSLGYCNVDLNGYAIDLNGYTFAFENAAAFGTTDLTGGRMTDGRLVYSVPNGSANVGGTFSGVQITATVAGNTLNFAGTTDSAIVIKGGNVKIAAGAVVKEMVIDQNNATTRTIQNLGTIETLVNDSENTVEVLDVQPENTGGTGPIVDASAWDGVSVTPVTPSENVYSINTAAELAWIAQEVNAGRLTAAITVELNRDINLNSKQWTPIGGDEAFTGTFDGKGHTVKNLRSYATDSYTRGIALFGYAENAVIKNIKIVNCDLQGRYAISAVAGDGCAPLTFENIEVVSGTIQANKDVGNSIGMVAGGILGQGWGPNGSEIKFINCVNRADVTANKWHAGGIWGSITTSGGEQVQEVIVTNCHNYGAIESKVAYAGGLGAWLYGKACTITDSTNSGTLKAPDDDKGNATTAQFVARFNDQPLN
ncbi:SipW-dependent-type signal peptide-containing protein [Candidatus Soleaferrea massiliensis]|uniref:SipW-dependent-type signal peptide-containing protein n=1 Tax=Candidatus Soleaferrea massiliensis TaxID=1470354 RepID=UPI00058B248D|nr:SipW-dependent-type signal peptide-containing protein [Candidatus Soleaferrea massiliensis]